MRFKLFRRKPKVQPTLSEFCYSRLLRSEWAHERTARLVEQALGEMGLHRQPGEGLFEFIARGGQQQGLPLTAENVRTWLTIVERELDAGTKPEAAFAIADKEIGLRS